jgi:hypothetical protein
MPRKLIRAMRLAAAVASILGSATASAGSADDLFSLHGYGTLGVVHSDEDQADFVNSSLIQPKGAGHTDAWSTAVDSKVGLQLDVNINDRLSAVVQLVSEAARNNTWDGDENEDYVPSLEWANLSYQVTDDLTVRAGRIVLPLLMESEFRKVGFAQHWIRPPVEAYGEPPFTSSDGIDVSYRRHAGAMLNTLRAHYGYGSLRAIFKTQVTVWGVNDTIEMGALTLRAAYMSVHFQSPLPGFTPLLQNYANLTSAFGAQGQAAAAQARYLDMKYSTWYGQAIRNAELGFSYDPGRWFFLGEVVVQRTDSIPTSYDSGYLSGGYRVGSFTPYATFARIKQKKRSEMRVATAIAGTPPNLAGAIAGMGAAINGVVSGIVDVDTSQQTFGVGLRWDLASNFALKTQYEYVDLDAGSIGRLGNIQPGFEPGGSLNVVSVAVSYIF